MTVYAYRTHAAATADLHRQIVRNFGTDPAVLDDLTFQTLDCPDQRTGQVRKCIAVYPTKEGAHSDKLMVALYD
jgi:hypothetical protein